MRIKSRWLVVAIIVGLVSLGMIAAACGDDDGDTDSTDGDATAPAAGEATTVNVELSDFLVSPSSDSVSAGSVAFNASNASDIQIHNLRVIRTDLEPDALPVDEETFTVDEEQLEVVASSDNLDVGGAEEVSADLEAGSYVLICNIATHYDLGMRVGFTVE